MSQPRSGLGTAEHRVYVLCLHSSHREAGLLRHLPERAAGKQTKRGNAIDKRHLAARHPCAAYPLPLPSSRAVELWHLQKLQHFASESPGKQISRHPHDLDPSRASTSAACAQTRDELNSATGLVCSILWGSRRATSTYPTRLTHEPVLEAVLPPNGLDFRLLEQNGRTNPPRR